MAASWAGIETVAFCEIEPFCRKVLEKHWPGVPKLSDIRQLTAESLKEAGVDIAAIDIVAGGPPCQPASTAGKRKGTGDDRWLWPEAIRIVAALKPRWILFENPTGILSLQGGVPFESVLSELEAEGYWNYKDYAGRKRIAPIIIPACAVGTPHRRDRVWILAHTRSRGFSEQSVCLQQQGGTETVCTSKSRDVAHANSIRRCKQDTRDATFNQKQNNSPYQRQGEAKFYEVESGGENVANAQGHRLQGERAEGKPITPARCVKGESERLRDGAGQCRTIKPCLGGNFARLPRGMDGNLWPAPFGREQYEWEPPRTAKGVPDRANRIKALGNAIVPHVAYEIFRAMVAVEVSMREA